MQFYVSLLPSSEIIIIIKENILLVAAGHCISKIKISPDVILVCSFFFAFLPTACVDVSST
jgi:hypothetical protein